MRNLGVSGLMAVALAGAAGAQESERYTNLQVLPVDVSPDELGEAMLRNTLDLGLPRLAGQGCLHCHVGDIEVPRREWDYASDAKPEKRKARAMMAMVRAINERYLGRLESRLDPEHEVRCATCHAGRVDPRPLEAVLWSTYASEGFEVMVERYRALRERHYGGDAYDFRPDVLAGLARRVADESSADDALALAVLNRDANPGDAEAERAWLQFVLERAAASGGAEAALSELEARRESLSPGVMGPDVLDGLGWHLYRREQRALAVRLMTRNHELFPEEYTTLESVAWVTFDAGDRERAFALLEAWLAEHPDHARARRLLTNLRARPE